jgi:hypothetical protein
VEQEEDDRVRWDRLYNRGRHDGGQGIHGSGLHGITHEKW